MRVRRFAVTLVAAVAVSATGGGTAAFAGTGPSPGAAQVSVAKKKAKVLFAAAGIVTGVDGTDRTVTVAVKGGTKDVRGKVVTFAVPVDAPIRLNGHRVSIGTLAAGQRIAVIGTRADDVCTARWVEATDRGKHHPAPATPPAPA